MELRIHGIGGPTAESTLRRSAEECSPQPGEHAFALWRSQPSARSAVRALPRGADTAVYHWAPLTSGSVFFALWPVLLPFTLVSVGGWMLPRSGPRGASRGRDDAGRALVAVLAWSTTVAAVLWICWLGQVLAVHLLDRSPTIERIAGLLAAALAVAALVGIATWTGRGFERYPPGGTDTRARRDADRRQLASAGFFHDAPEHRRHWRTHTLLALAGLAVAVVVVHRRDLPWELSWELPALGDLAAGTVAVQCGLLMLLGLCCLPGSRQRLRGDDDAPALLGGASAVAVGTMLVPGLTVAGAVVVAGREVPAGRALIFFDVFGWSVAALLAVSVAVLAVRLARPVPAELEVPKALGRMPATVLARLATVPRALDLALAAMGLTLTGGGVAVVVARWGDAVDGGWCLDDSAPVTIARLTIVFLVGFMVVSVVRRRADEASRRRVGNVWDVLTFWPRSHHPFAVRPYAERAVPELQEYVALAARDRGPVTIVAHSQGSVLALAALLPSVGADGDAGVLDDLRLVTMGSPIRSLYQRFFPAAVRPEDVQALARALQERGRGWINLYRATDHVGRAVFGSDRTPGAGDRLLPDPPAAGTPVAGHSGYWTDPVVEAAVAGPDPSDPGTRPQELIP